MRFSANLLISTIVFLVFSAAPSIVRSENYTSPLQKGVSEYEIGNIDNAIKSFDEAIKLNPNLPETYIKRGDAKFNLYQFKEAIKDYTYTIKLDNSSIYAYTKRAAAYEILEEKAKAQQDYQTASKIPVVSSKEYAEKGYLLLQKHQYNDALKFLNKSIDIDPKNIKSFLWRAFTYEHTKSFQKAIDDYDLAIKNNPKYTYIHIKKWNIYKNSLHMQDQAESALNQAEKINYVYANILAGSNLHGVDDKESLKYLDKAINAEKRNSKAYYERCNTHYNLKNYRQAIYDCQKHLDLGGQNIFAYEEIGSSYNQLKKYKEAIEMYSLAISQLPDYAMFYADRAVSFSMIDNHQSALNDFNKAIELDSEKSYYYEARGLNYAFINKYTEAYSDFNKAIQLNPNNYYAHKGRGIIYARWNRHDEALSDFNQALQIAQKESRVEEVNYLKIQIDNVKRIKKINLNITIISICMFCVFGFVIYISSKRIKISFNDLVNKKSQNSLNSSSKKF
jgi:tetratricopeptide (TPR) repeat protein